MTNPYKQDWSRITASSDGDFMACDKNGEVIEHTPAPEESAPLRHEHLTAYIQRIERLEAEKDNIAFDVREIYKEAEGTGFDPKIMRKVVSERKKDEGERQEYQALFDLYWVQAGGGE